MGSTIVCGLDTEHGAFERPVRLASELARRLGLPLVVAYVAPAGRVAAGARGPDTTGVIAAPGPALPYPYPLAADGPELEQIREDVQRRLERAVHQCGVPDAQLEVVMDPSPAEGLRRIAADRDAEMLVVGSRGHGAFRAALLGSTSHSLAGNAACPVLVVPPDDESD